ncbi:UDP-N-acetylmuramoyl-L-alanyl-D-glutamate--2,6-diaminopimelate ligase [Candidatus Falkowbacteria bacterium]|jgi:UDP-N-acetylmuramoyl-L-alanyl-D-glutamate--2,6-diaminopimelate ligase|nr:UDP-N-acetylmuramoyl-L-alanyl-D-glutamate--2,6-diaminopimelate ligase [Candidatus Falkowbacteria bacterium]MBT7006991.1 UDP-N-acetylmuramoyl-L-alanyl-D-glutamate--2,6-diaminopimelate ligase [Candidatus Falkowbacteria bacterium]
MKTLLKKILPKSFISLYHKTLAVLAAFVYRFPSEKMIVVGVTGTNGKSSTVELIAKALESGGAKVGAASTVKFKIAAKEKLNDKKMTMLGRFQLQKMLKQMVEADCRYAVIEVSSEGIKQFRHLGINFDYAVFTNLTPEHIESHGSFDNYKRAKAKLFKRLSESKNKLIDGKTVTKTILVNADDEHGDYYLEFKADKKIEFSLGGSEVSGFVATQLKVLPTGTSFVLNEQSVDLQLVGEFNVYNVLPAFVIGLEEGLTFSQIKGAVESVEVIPGRMETIDQGQNFYVIVDYAPEVASMDALYKTINKFKTDNELNINRIIHVFGSCGGGRDKDRRKKLGKIVGWHSDIAIVTNEDPYDDDPMEIIDEVANGVLKRGKKENQNLFKILDRKEAIAKALSLAKENDLVLVTGKGSEQAMAIKHGKYVQWDDREVIKDILNTNKESR